MQPRPAAGLVTLEPARGDGSVTDFVGARNGLALGSINMLGSEEPAAAFAAGVFRLEKLSAFALTEPGHDADSVGLEITARRDGDHWVLNGANRGSATARTHPDLNNRGGRFQQSRG